jgi:hypothetical protein
VFLKSCNNHPYQLYANKEKNENYDEFWAGIYTPFDEFLPNVLPV